MTPGADGLLHQLRLALQRQYERHAAELAQLVRGGADEERDGVDAQTAAALTGSARQGLIETMAALRRMADGRYGSCQRCGREIPVERLQILPHARFCVPCQEISDR